MKVKPGVAAPAHRGRGPDGQRDDIGCQAAAATDSYSFVACSTAATALPASIPTLFFAKSSVPTRFRLR